MLFNIIKNAGVYCPGAKTCWFQNPVYFHYNILYKLSYSQQHLALLKYKFMINFFGGIQQRQFWLSSLS